MSSRCPTGAQPWQTFLFWCVPAFCPPLARHTPPGQEGLGVPWGWQPFAHPLTCLPLPNRLWSREDGPHKATWPAGPLLPLNGSRGAHRCSEGMVLGIPKCQGSGFGTNALMMTLFSPILRSQNGIVSSLLGDFWQPSKQAPDAPHFPPPSQPSPHTPQNSVVCTPLVGRGLGHLSVDRNFCSFKNVVPQQCLLPSDRHPIPSNCRRLPSNPISCPPTAVYYPLTAVRCSATAV